MCLKTCGPRWSASSTRQIQRGLFTSHSVKVEGNDARYRFSEGFERSTVVGVEDSPGLEVRDDLLDDPPSLVDLTVVFLLPRVQFPARRLLVRCQHAVTHVTFVADPISGIQR